MKFYEQFNKKIILTTTPPRSGGMFLFYLLKDYFPDNYDIDIIFSKHNASFLTVDNPYIVNVMTVRNPVDMACSMLYYSTNEINNNKTSPQVLIDGLHLILEDFYKNFFYSNNNILFSFDNIVNNTEKCIETICNYIGQEYNNNYVVDIKKLKDMDKKPYDIYTYNFPRDIPVEEYKKNRFIVLSNPIIKKMIIKHQEFINLCIENNIKGMYV